MLPCLLGELPKYFLDLLIHSQLSCDIQMVQETFLLFRIACMPPRCQDQGPRYRLLTSL